jgi:hypothetical protein
LEDNLVLLTTLSALPRRPRAMFAPAGPADNPLLRDLAAELQTYVREAAAHGAPVHEAERAIGLPHE